MYNTFQLARKYLLHQLSAENGKGHGIHSPFVYQLVRDVFNSKSLPPSAKSIESIRKQLLKNNNSLLVNDYGAGASKGLQRKRSVRQIAAKSLKSPKYARLLYRLANYFQPANILELGTSLGITTAYLATAVKEANTVTLEGADAVASIAKEHFNQLALNNVHVVTGPFDETLPDVLRKMGKLDFVFIDGNHAYAPTLRYFNAMLPFVHSGTVMILDDIHWSAEMEKAWQAICKHSAVTLSIDLFFVGILFFREEQLYKQHFRIRF